MRALSAFFPVFTLPKRNQAPRWMIWAAFAAVYLIWGSTFLAIRFALESMPPFLMAGSRFLVAGLALYSIARWRGNPKPTREQWKSASLIGILLITFGNGAVVLAELKVASGVVALLISTEPLWVVVLDRYWNRRPWPGWRVGLGLAIGMAGVALLLFPLNGIHAADPASSVIVLLAAVAWAAGSIYGKQANLPPSPLLSGGVEMAVGGAILTLIGTLRGEWMRVDPEFNSVLPLIAWYYLVIFGSIVAYTAYVWLLKVTSVARVSTYAYVNPVVAVLLGWAFASEPLHWRTAAATLVIGASVLLITSHPARVRNPSRKGVI